MSAKYKINLRRIDVVDKKLRSFLFLKKKVDRTFTVEKNGIAFEIGMGLTGDVQNLFAYTDIEFEAELDINLALFEQENTFILDTEELKLLSSENVRLKEDKEAEGLKLEEQLRDLFPLVLEAFNTFRSACKVALYKELVAGRVLTRNIQDSQIHWGIEADESLEEYFSGDDTVFLFGVFVNLSLSSFTGDADIEYRVSDAEGRIYEGVFKNGHKGLHSGNRFFENLDKIQNLIKKGWTIETEALLTSFEFLYFDNYRMAVFNAATVLEFVVIEFWEKKQKELNDGTREEKVLAARLNRKINKARYPTSLEKIIRIVLPEFINQDLVKNGNLERCINAWNIRNTRLAHLYAAQVGESKQLEVTHAEAWSSVASIVDLVDHIKKLSSQPE